MAADFCKTSNFRDEATILCDDYVRLSLGLCIHGVNKDRDYTSRKKHTEKYEV